MRFLLIFLVFLFSAVLTTAQPYGYGDDFYIMADDDLDFDEFGISGGPVNLPVSSYPVSSKYRPTPVTLPIQTSENQPITLPLQKSTRELITLPVITKQNQPMNVQPIVHTQYIDQPLTQYRYIEQPIIQPRLIEQPKLQQRVIQQPIYRQQITQPVVVPRITTQPIIHQRIVEQPIYQHRLIERSVIQPTLVDVPVTKEQRVAQAVELPAAEPIVQRENVQGKPIYRSAPTITQAPVTQPIQMPTPSTKKGGQRYGALPVMADRLSSQTQNENFNMNPNMNPNMNMNQNQNPNQMPMNMEGGEY